ncbi:MAG: glycosyltransferase family 4 protein [Gemmatimonadota bacterium]
MRDRQEAASLPQGHFQLASPARSTTRPPLSARPVRVLIVCDHIGYGQALHGAGRMMVEMTMGFRPDRVQVTSCVLRAGPELEDRMGREGVPLRFFGAHRFSLVPLARIIRLVREHQIDVIHVTDFQADTLGRLAGKITGIPVIVHVRSHHSKYQKRPYPWYMERINKVLAPGTALAISNSDSLAGFAIERMGFRETQVVTVHNPVSTFTMKPVEPEAVTRLRQEYGLEAPGPVIGAVTRFYASKGITYLIGAFPAVLARFPSARLVLVGDGPLADELKAQAQALGIADHVIFTGFRQDAEAHVQLFTLSAVPSLEEGIGNVAIESIVGGVPVVASREGGLPEVIAEGKSGLLVPPADSAALSAAIISVLENPELLQRLRLGCREEAGRFSIDTYTARLEELYRQVVTLSGAT